MIAPKSSDVAFRTAAMTVTPELDSFLDRLDGDACEALDKLGVHRRHPRGSALFFEGDSAGSVVVVLAGRVKITSMSLDGREVVLAVRGPGDLLSELSAIDGEARSATATALEPVESLVISGPSFTEFLERTPAAGLALLRILSSRMRAATRTLAEYGVNTSTERVAKRLVELAERYGASTSQGVRIDLPLSQEELAGWTGSSREAVSKALGVLRAAGLVETGRRSITVLDLEGLREFS